MFLQDPSPVIVRIIEEPAREPGMVDVLIGAISLVGIILLLGLVVGVVFGLLVAAFRRWRPAKPIRVDQLTR